MWNRYRIPVAIIGLGFAASALSADVSFAARSRDYTPRELRTVLRGLGYNITPGDTLNDDATRAVVRQFQQGYKLQVDGIAGPQTQNLAADLVKILKANLNLVLKPSPALPSTQFWDDRTEAAIKRYQEQSNLSVTGIATLPLRQKLDQEAENILNGKPSPTPSSSPSPSPSSTPRRLQTPRTTPSPSPRATPQTAPSASPRTSPSPTQRTSPSPSPAPTTTPGTGASPSGGVR
jgi:hypothetical protein